MIQVENLNLRINSPFREQYRLKHQPLEKTTDYYTYYLDSYFIVINYQSVQQLERISTRSAKLASLGRYSLNTYIIAISSLLYIGQFSLAFFIFILRNATSYKILLYYYKSIAETTQLEALYLRIVFRLGLKYTSIVLLVNTFLSFLKVACALLVKQKHCPKRVALIRLIRGYIIIEKLNIKCLQKLVKLINTQTSFTNLKSF